MTVQRFTTRTASGAPIDLLYNAPDRVHFVHIPSKAERLRDAANALADVVSAAWSFGHPEETWMPIAEAIDDLASLADLIEPRVDVTFCRCDVFRFPPMSAEQTVTEREAVRREREAFQRGAMLFSRPALSHCDFRERAAKEYPLPKITRPRVVVDASGLEWRFASEPLRLQVACGRGWMDAADEAFRVTPERVKLWADLLANPTEETEDDGSASDA